MANLPETQPAASALGTVLRSRRVELGLSQTDLGSDLGVPQNRISDWELGYRVPTVESLIRISKALDVDVSVLVEAVAAEAVA